jgi:NADH pyrophosphatase NudC (nudix superfamily)
MVRKGSFAIVIRGSKILLVKMPPWANFGNHWNFPGGFVNKREHLEEAAERETLEETGITCEVEQAIESIRNGADLEITIFIARYIKGEIVVQEAEVADAKWFSMDEAQKLPLAYNIRPLLDKLSAESP